MTENEGQKELIPSGKDIVPPPSEPLSPEDARASLQIVVSTAENSVIPSDQVAGFSMEQIREAVAVVGEDLMGRHPRNEYKGYQETFKKFKSIQAKLILFKRSETEEPDGVWLQVDDPGVYEVFGITTTFLWAKIGLDGMARSLFKEHMFESRRVLGIFKQREYVGYKRTEFYPNDGQLLRSRQFGLDDYRHIFRGMRWVFANMLAWDKPRIILPEELNRNLLLG